MSQGRIRFDLRKMSKDELRQLVQIPGEIEVLYDNPEDHLSIEDLPLLRAGDQIFVRTEISGPIQRWFVGFAIRVCTFTKRDKRPTVVNHVATVVREIRADVTRFYPYGHKLKIVDYLIAEALAGGFQYRNLLEVYGDPERYSFAVARHKLVTQGHREKIVAACFDLFDKGYGYLKVAANAGDYGLTMLWNGLGGRGDVRFFRWFCGMKDYPMCSWASLYQYAKAGVPFSVPVRIGSPDDLWDECRRKWPEIWVWPFVSRRLYHELWRPEGLGGRTA